VNTADLRTALKQYAILAHANDLDAAADWFDLARALGDEPGFEGVLTPRQRHAISLHLIGDRSVRETAAAMQIDSRTVYLIVNTGLKRIVRFLQSGERPRWNRYSAWTERDTRRIISNARLPRKELAIMLGRSVSSVYQKLSELRAHGLLIASGQPGRPIPTAHGTAGKRQGVSNPNGSAVGAPPKERSAVGLTSDRGTRGPSQAQTPFGEA
jgi:hypothetical protein